MSENDPSTLRKFILGIASTGAGTFITIILGFLCIFLYTRWLSKEEYGIFILIQLIMSLSISFSNFGIDNSVSKFLAGSENLDNNFQLINTALFFRLSTLIGTCVVLFIVYWVLIITQGSTMFNSFFIYIPILVVIEALTALYGKMFIGVLRFDAVALLDIIYSVTSFILTVLVLIIFHQGVLGLIYTRLIARTFALIIGYFLGGFKHRWFINLKLLKEMLHFGFPLYVNNFLNFAFTRVDSFIVGGFLGPTQIALYEVARKIPESLEMMYTAFLQVYFPIVTKFYASGEKDKASRMLNYANRLLSFVCVLGALGAFLFQKEIVTLLFSEQYLASAPIFALLVFGLTLIVLDNNLGNTLVAIGSSDKPPQINIVRTVISFSGYFSLIPRLGIIGAVLSNLIATSFVNPVNAYFLHRKQIKVTILSYIKPILLYLIFIQIPWLTGVHGYLWSLLLLGSFIITNLLVGVITVGDMSKIFREVISMLRLFYQTRIAHINS